MQSAASKRSGHTSAREASQDPAKTTSAAPRSIPDQRPLARQGQGSVGGVGVTEMREVAQWRGVENRAVANSPGARDASGCQHFYIGDRPRLLGGIKTEAFSGEPRMGGVDFGAPLKIEDLGGHQSLGVHIGYGRAPTFEGGGMSSHAVAKPSVETTVLHDGLLMYGAPHMPSGRCVGHWEKRHTMLGLRVIWGVKRFRAGMQCQMRCRIPGVEGGKTTHQEHLRRYQPNSW